MVCFPLDKSFHLNLLVEFTETSIVNSGQLSTKVVCVSLESKLALLVLKILRTIFEHQRLESNVELAPNVCHFNVALDIFI